MTGKDEAKLALLSAARAYRRAEAVLKARRDELHAAIVRSLEAGETKSQVARDTGYTREYVTTLIKDKDAAKRGASVD